jgi:hypothetical protein
MFKLIGTFLTAAELVSSNKPNDGTLRMAVKPATCKYFVRNSSLRPVR